MPSDAAALGLRSQPVLTVDLGSIVANYRRLERRLGPARCAGVVKADAYGLGASQVAPALAAAGCRHFFVAHLEEGASLAKVLAPDAAIFVLHGPAPGEEDALRRVGCIPVLNDLGQIERWRRTAMAAGARLPAAVHFDTGLNRLGLSEAETHILLAEPDRLDGIDLRLVMSHLACADEPDHALNARQAAAFRTIAAAFPAARSSLANSSGIFLGAEYHCDLVRPGCALYGINPRPGQPNPMAQVARLASPILQVRHVDRAGTVGYGASHRVAAGARVAIVATGYADGWLRTLSNLGSALVKGIRVPIIGRVSMDLITLDVTAVPGARAGDAAELIGGELTADDVATTAGTIAYEVLARLGSRVQRRYLPAAPGSA